MADNWLSTDAMIAEVCDDAVKNYGGTTILSIRCPDKEIEKKVRAYLNSKRGGKTIDTYVGGPNDSVKATPYEGDDTPAKTRRKKGYMPPIEEDDEGDDTPYESLEQMADCKHDAQMADLTPEDPDLDGLV